MKYIKAGSTFLQKAKDTGKICRLNIKIYSESSLYIKEEYIQMLPSSLLK